jgi:hypothetical protein
LLERAVRHRAAPMIGASSFVKAHRMTWRPYFSAGDDFLAVGRQLRLSSQRS